MSVVRLPDSLIAEAKSLASLHMRSVPKQIEYYYTLGKMAEENPDLPMSFIKEALAAKVEIDSGDVTPFEFDD